jgi:ankyrin repeat protein
MLLNAGADIEAALPNCDRPLHVALINEQEDTAVSIINRGANITARASMYRTPLHICSEYDLPFAARVLLDRGASTEDINDETWTPLCCCIGANFADFLIANGANVNYKNKNGWSPLHQAIHERDYGLAEILLMNGAKVGVRTMDDGLSVMERAMDIPKQEDAERFMRLLMTTIGCKAVEEAKKESVKAMDWNVEEEESDEEGDDVGGKSVMV